MPVTFHLHRINTSRFFFPGSPPSPAAADAMVDARLPRPCMTFYAPSADNSTGSMDFTLFRRGRDMVLAADQKGRATISNAVRAAPALTKPKKLPSVSVAVGDSLYILDPTSSRDHCFEALIYKPGGATDDLATTGGLGVFSETETYGVFSGVEDIQSITNIAKHQSSTTKSFKCYRGLCFTC